MFVMRRMWKFINVEMEAREPDARGENLFGRRRRIRGEMKPAMSKIFTVVLFVQFLLGRFIEARES